LDVVILVWGVGESCRLIFGSLWFENSGGRGVGFRMKSIRIYSGEGVVKGILGRDHFGGLVG
jgi:hypothetical protein